MTTGWTVEVEVAADHDKIPDGPIEAAKCGLDQVRGHVTSAHVKVEHQAEGVIRTWLVDTSTGEVTTLREYHGADPDREEYLGQATAESLCEWPEGSHYDGLFHVTDDEFGDVAVACGNHLVDKIAGVGLVHVAPYDNENGD